MRIRLARRHCDVVGTSQHNTLPTSNNTIHRNSRNYRPAGVCCKRWAAQYAVKLQTRRHGAVYGYSN